nr:myosin va [Hymenolepis microstoma]
MEIINEPEVLHTLKTRFCNQKDIYTYCGLLLVVLNPYKDLPIYSADFMSAYHQNSVDSEIKRDPHIFAIADEALSRMKILHQNQSIIISGESGAGKTVSAGHVLTYLTVMTSQRCCAPCKNEDSMQKRVLASSPLLESLGNARTLRNDNSSRFGKFIEVYFSQISNRLIRANIKTFLLEKSRVVLQNEQERNYHIFYQILAAANDPTFQNSFPILHNLHLSNFSTFNYSNLKDSGRDDLVGFETTMKAMLNLGFNKEEIVNVLTLLAAILHLGNVTFTETAQDGSQIDAGSEKSLSYTLRALSCENDAEIERDITSTLCHRIIRAPEGDMKKSLNVQEAVYARDSLAKLIYQQLFNWIVIRCNEALNAPSEPESKENCIGILDIYGFEVMEVNSFEQFCINFANEKLQQRFVKNVFQLEQEEYMCEGLEWAFVDYYDNEPCIELFEGPMGLIPLLNDECKLPKPQDNNWLARICNEHLGRSRNFSQSKLWAKTRFIVQHFSEAVEYTVEGFVEKNLDRIIPEHVNILVHSENQILKEMMKDFEGANNGVGKHQGIFTKPTVITQFSESLKSLMEILNSTTCHYVRCIKPNDEKAPFTFCPERVMQQLRACGVLQTVKISAAGYPSRCSYEDFLSRYWQLSPQGFSRRDDPIKQSELIIKNILEDSSKYRLGKTKIFLGNGVLAHFERIRSARIIQASVKIQKYVRGWLVRRHYQYIRQLIIAIQAQARQWLAVKRVEELQEEKHKQSQSSVSIRNSNQGDSKSEKSSLYNRTLGRLRTQKSAKPNKVNSEMGKLKREVEILQSKLDARDVEIAAMKSKVKQENTRKSKKRRQNKIKFTDYHSGDTDSEYEQVNYPSRGSTQPNLHLIKPTYNLLNDPNDSNKSFQAVNTPAEPPSLVFELQQKCALQDIEKQELYQRLEMYQVNFALAKTRQMETEKSLQQLEKLIEEQSSRSNCRSSEAQTDGTDVTNLEAILEVQRESNRRLQKEVELLNFENSQLQLSLNKQATELQMLKESKRKVAEGGLETNVSRVVKENLQLRDQLSTSNALNRRLVSSTKYFAELVHRQAPECLQLSESPYFLDVRQLIAIAQSRADRNGFHDFESKSKLVRCQEGKESEMVTYLINHINSSINSSWSPLFVADFMYILLRGADAVHDEYQISTLLKVLIEYLQKTLTNQSTTYNAILFWIVNIFGLRSRVYQYGDKAEIGDSETTAEEEEEEDLYALKNYNIDPFLPIFADFITLGLQIFMGRLNEILLPPPLITGAILEYEPIPNLSCQALTVSTTGGLRPSNTWLRRKPHFDRFMNTLDNIYNTLLEVHADAILIWLTFYRIFYYVCTSTLNSILIRKDLCNWARGAQIRHNLATLETWLSDRDIAPEAKESDFYRHGRRIMDLLQPLIQVCIILQSKKGGSDNVQISSLCQQLPNLTSSQIFRLLSRCSLISGMEERVQPEFLAAVSRRLRDERPQKTFKTICCGLEVSQRTLLLDSDYWASVNEEVPFPQSPTPLPELQIPEELDGLNEFIVAIDM